MKVEELMRRAVVTVRSDDPLLDAAHEMLRHGCGSVVVVDGLHRPIGMLTDRDVCLEAARTDCRLSELRAEEAMHRGVHSCAPEDSIEAAEQKMARHRVRRLPVVGASGRLEGLLSLDDLAGEAWRERGLFAPPVSASGVGRTLGESNRPRLVERP